MPDETEPTPATPAPDETEPAARPEGDAAERRGVQVPKWLAVGVIAAALAGGGFAVGHATASDHHGDFAPIGDNRQGGPGGEGRGGPGGPDRGRGGDANAPGAPDGNGNSNSNGNGDTNSPTTPSTTPATTGTTGA